MEPKKDESVIQASQQKDFSDSEDVCVKEEDSAEARGTKRLLAMAGLFDHWKAPKVSDFWPLVLYCWKVFFHILKEYSRKHDGGGGKIRNCPLSKKL